MDPAIHVPRLTADEHDTLAVVQWDFGGTVGPAQMMAARVPGRPAVRVQLFLDTSDPDARAVFRAI